MLRRFSRRFAPRVKHHDELAKMMKENSHVLTKATEESGVHFRDIRPAPLNESMDAKRRRLIYQSRYRGMVEMDIILGCFLKQNIGKMTNKELDEYDVLLRQFDNDLFKWIVLNETPPVAMGNMETFKALQTFVKDERESLLGPVL